MLASVKSLFMHVFTSATEIIIVFKDPFLNASFQFDHAPPHWLNV